VNVSNTIYRQYGMPQDALEDLCDTLIVEEAYFDLFGEEQQAFHDWAFENAHDYETEYGVDWREAFQAWREQT